MIREALELEFTRHPFSWVVRALLNRCNFQANKDEANGEMESLFKAIQLIYHKSLKSINKCRLYPVLVSLSLGRLQNNSISREASLRSTTQGCSEPEM